MLSVTRPADLAIMQGWFDKIWEHAGLRQPSYLKGDELCAYRGANGAKCFVGVLIPDDKYDPNWDLSDSGGVISSGQEAMRTMLGVGEWTVECAGLRFLGRAQSIHDGAATAKWDVLLNNLARNFKLKPGTRVPMEERDDKEN